MTKKELRRHIRELKAEYCSWELRAESQEVMHQIEQDADFQSADTVLLYWSLPDEPDTHGFASRWADKKMVLLPVVKGDDLKLKAFRGMTGMREGAFAILEPDGADFEDYDRIGFAAIPGMAFDNEGHRLGRGKGYYDRLLPKLHRTRKAGICFSFQVVSSVPTEPHDVLMDKVIHGIGGKAKGE